MAVKHDQFVSLKKKDWQEIIDQEVIIFDLKGIVPRDFLAIKI